MAPNGTSPKVVIITAFISVLGSIAVAFIGIVPRYYETKASLSTEKCNITGNITSADNKPLKNADIYLIRATGNENVLTTDDFGNFAFDKVPLASYWIVVRNNDSGQTSRVLIEKQNPDGEIKVMEARLKYQLTKE